MKVQENTEAEAKMERKGYNTQKMDKMAIEMCANRMNEDGLLMIIID